jgi:hypothetical protein
MTFKKLGVKGSNSAFDFKRSLYNLMEREMYIRLIRKNEMDPQGQEVLINLDHISKIEVKYYGIIYLTKLTQ